MSLEQEINCSKIAYDWAKKTYNNRRFADGEPYYDPSLDGSFMRYRILRKYIAT